jgi:hypothetical protein
MREIIKSKKFQTIAGILMVAAFAFTAAFADSSIFSLNRTASAGYGSDNHHHHKKKKKKKKKTSQKTIQKKVAEFSYFNNSRSIAAYRTVSALKQNNPARFRALQQIFKKYNTVGGRLKVKPNAQTLNSINMFRSYEGYSMYLKYAAKLK